MILFEASVGIEGSFRNMEQDRIKKNNSDHRFGIFKSFMVV